MGASTDCYKHITVGIAKIGRESTTMGVGMVCQRAKTAIKEVTVKSESTSAVKFEDMDPDFTYKAQSTTQISDVCDCT